MIWKKINVITGIVLSLAGACSSHANNSVDYSVQVSATVQAAPAQITLQWPQSTSATPESYTIYRRTPGTTSWGSGQSLSGTTTNYVDRQVTAGTPYEYQIVKKTAANNGYGYIYAGVNVPLDENRGKLLLVVDKTYAGELAPELGRLQQDLIGDGWTVTRLDVNRGDSVESVKSKITDQYRADPKNVKAVFLFGHVPVPYSGDIVPDGHYREHEGAWPCDGYYADMDGVWTDDSINDTRAIDPRNRNVPGDGKFDQSTFPAPLKLMIGRVDLANMPGKTSVGGPATFPNELALLRNYLNKDHNFRTKVTTAPDRAIVGDYFGTHDGEAFAASGWRNFAPFFGAANVTTLKDQGTWINALHDNAYLWAYGCGAGSYTSIGGIGNVGSYDDGVTTDIVKNNLKAVFTLLYGSWLGDWDSEDNIQRAVLATADYGLTCAWSGRPHWFMHHMALGEPIGYSTLVTQNNGFDKLYQTQKNNCANWVHIALMGDPTLRMQVVAPPASVTAVANGNNVQLNWTPAKDSIKGYNVYRATDANGPFTRVNDAVVTDTTYTDADAASGNYTYMVRAVKLESSGSGTYFNLSEGEFASTENGSQNVSIATRPALDNRGTTTPAVSAPAQPTKAPASDKSVAQKLSPTGATAGTSANDWVWFDDHQPVGASLDSSGGDGWNWVAANPAPFSGTLCHVSANVAGLHQHLFTRVTGTMTVNTGDTLVAYVYVNPNSVPSELMLQWNDGNGWEHRAYWGANTIQWGTDNTVGRYYAGAMPTPGQWTRLEIPAAKVGLEGIAVKGMAFTLQDGSAAWDYIGKSTASSSSSNNSTNTPSGGVDTSWVNDSVPNGAKSDASGGDTWNWTSSNPAPESGALAHSSATASGMHQHFFMSASQTLTVNTGDTLYAYVYIDPANPPSQVMLQWNDGSWEHRAYWGVNNIYWGTDGTASLRKMGPVPAGGQWTRLEVPASQLGLEGSTISGMAFTLYGGHAVWDNAGKSTPSSNNPSGSITNTPPANGGSTNTGGTSGTGTVTNTPPVVDTNTPPANATTTSDTSWVDDSVPKGGKPDSSGGDTWNWTSSNPAPESGSLAHSSATASGMHQHFFMSASQTLTVNPGESLYAYVYIDPANPPSQVMLQWNDGSWEHRAYWGVNNIYWGTEGTAGLRKMGPVPAGGQWTRLEVPASQLGLEGSTISGMAFTLYGGHAVWDNAGKSTISTNNPSGSITNTPPANGGSTNNGSTNNGDTSGTGTVTNTPPVVGTNTPPVASTNPPPTTTNLPPAASISTNGLLPGTSIVDNIALRMPHPGDYALHVLTPTLLELKLINTKDPDPAVVTSWNLVNNFVFSAPPLNAFAVTANGQSVGVQAVGFKRRPLYAPLAAYDLRIENSMYLQLSSPISDNQTIVVQNPNGSLWPATTQFTATVDPLRYSPAIHVNQEGYMPNYTKKAMVGYYTGNLGELNVPSTSGFKIVDASGNTVYTGTLVQRPDVGYLYSPTPYQQVYEADFTAFNTPGQYRLVVPGMGASLPFSITDGIAMNFARTYALGIYHQRCGTDNSMPYTRFTHDKCHTAPVAVPTSAAAFPFTWTTIANYANTINPDNPVSTAPRLTSPAAQLFPFVNQGPIDVSGGHHDAGDYSKYTLNSVAFIHYMMFAVDSIPGVSDLDNLGIPESGDGISDVMQEMKWEADFLAKMQDSDGGFYFLVYPQTREYESNVTPDHGDPQLVWPKTSSATASSVAALAEVASSPKFKAQYPQAAAMYMQKALLGWQFLTNAIAKYGKNGIYQKITHYGDDFADQDELAWAAAAMYVATGDPQYQNTLFQWFPDPTNPATFRWGWWKLFLSYGNAVRDYAFAARSGRLPQSKLDPSYLAKCESVITGAGDDMVTWSKQNAYGTSFPEATKHVQGAGWYFSGEQTFDLTVAYQITPKQDYMDAILANMNYEGGCNPVNVSYVAGMGWKRERDAVSQYALNDRRMMPPTGEPIGNIQYGFSYLPNYGGSLTALNFPDDNATTAPHPFYDRWADSWNVSTEFVTFEQAKSLATYAFLAAQTSLKTQPWKAVQGTINVPSGTVSGPTTFTLSAPGVDLSSARITWETRDGEPAMGQSFTFAPKNNGSQWIEAEAQLPDGRRVFAATDFTADTPNVVWIDDAVPAGAGEYSDGGDSWTWISSNPTPYSGSFAHQSTLLAGTHQHFFRDATATMTVSTGATLYAWVYIDPANPPSEIMLQWYDNTGSWEHRAYWGANKLTYGTDGTTGRHYMGPLPAAGQWVQLQVPASAVGVEGATLTGMAYTLYDGRATWDASGMLKAASGSGSGSIGTVITPTITAGSGGPMLSWPSTAGAVYQVSYKTSLSDANWTNAGSTVTATSTTTTWTDTSAPTGSQRFYQVVRVQ
jgi:hypothetical protein